MMVDAFQKKRESSFCPNGPVLDTVLPFFTSPQVLVCDPRCIVGPPNKMKPPPLAGEKITLLVMDAGPGEGQTTAVKGEMGEDCEKAW